MKPSKQKRTKPNDSYRELGHSGLAMGALLLVSLLYAATII